MDWKLEILSNLWIFPQGMERHGAAGPNSLTWTSRYGSLAVSGYNISTVDGMNEPGLVVNAQWLANSKYPEDDGKTPRTSLSIWSQYFLDNFATVAESIAHIRANPFHVATGEIPGQPGRLSTLHLSLSDATGDSAILEWVDGKLRIHHDRRYQVMTNEPVFEDQLAIAQYWRQVDGLTFLPGTSRATDRFARASFYINAIPETDDPRVAAASVFSVIRNASVPYGISLSDQPNLSTTRWRVVADQKDKLYYFESAISPNVFWVDLKKVDFSPESGVRTLDLGDNQQIVFSGEVSSQFVTAKPFVFEAAQ
jgi:choloylglycine hydrolase